MNKLPVKRLAVLGHPVSHSRSPAMHSAALADLGLGQQWSYEAIDCEPERLPALIAGMAAQGFVGANVTVPHKQAALLAADSTSAAALQIGAANTLTFGPEGIYAENTDAPGLLEAIARPVAGKRALLLGAGGAARAVLWALAGAGADVSVWNRTQSKALELVAALGGSVENEPDPSRFEVIVNASAAGLGGDGGIESLPLDPGGFGDGQVVVDMVYGEQPSSLLAAAASAGASTVDGIEVLVRQGALSFQSWTGLEPSCDIMRMAARS